MKTISYNKTVFIFDGEHNTVTVRQPEKTWVPDPDFRPNLTVKFKKNDQRFTLYFDDAVSVRSTDYKTGVGEGIYREYADFVINGKTVSLKFATLTWVNKTNGKLFFELIPINEPERLQVLKVCWPTPWKWERSNKNAYTLLPVLYGMMIPSDWDSEIKVAPDEAPWFCTAWGNMAWYSQIDRKNGYLAVVETPWDASYYYHHHAKAKPTELYLYWVESLGKIGYRRVMHVDFLEDCDYVTVCKAYRRYIQEHNGLMTLKQKALQTPKIEEMAGMPIIHTWIYYNIKPEARIYDKTRPERNFRFTTFDRRSDEILKLVKKGLKKAYLHLDGWGTDGYDREHPDILPPCEKSGGSESMKRLMQTCRDHNILFALHDQYRDYYYDAASFDFKNATVDINGDHHFECTWNGGNQSVLCTALAPYYVERNYDMLSELGIEPDGVYLDVFSTTFLDECDAPMHRITRKDCVEYRRECLNRLTARGWIASSESPVDCFANEMVLCHHLPGSSDPFMSENGVLVPLFNLIFHDCVMVPWPMHYEDDAEIIIKSRFLLALLNGGAGYLEINADEAEIETINILSAFQKEVMYCAMDSHEFLSDDYKKQRTCFSNGKTVTVDFKTGEYTIE